MQLLEPVQPRAKSRLNSSWLRYGCLVLFRGRKPTLRKLARRGSRQGMSTHEPAVLYTYCSWNYFKTGADSPSGSIPVGRLDWDVAVGIFPLATAPQQHMASPTGFWRQSRHEPLLRILVAQEGSACLVAAPSRQWAGLEH